MIILKLDMQHFTHMGKDCFVKSLDLSFLGIIIIALTLYIFFVLDKWNMLFSSGLFHCIV